MASKRQIEKHDLKPGHSKLSEGGTRVITLTNDGADDKFSILISAQLLEGNSFSVEIADRLNRGDRIDVDISHLTLKIARASILWRDVNGIGRYTCGKQSGDGKFFLSLTCWWIATEATVEENFLFGSEAFK